MGNFPLGLPLTDLHLARIDRLEALVGRRYLGWCGLPDDAGFAVDVALPGADLTTTAARDGSGRLVTRHVRETLHLALGAALAAAEREGRTP